MASGTAHALPGPRSLNSSPRMQSTATLRQGFLISLRQTSAKFDIVSIAILARMIAQNGFNHMEIDVELINSAFTFLIMSKCTT